MKKRASCKNIIVYICVSNPKICKRKTLIHNGGFIVPLLTTVLSGVLGALINNNNNNN